MSPAHEYPASGRNHASLFRRPENGVVTAELLRLTVTEGGEILFVTAKKFTDEKRARQAVRYAFQIMQLYYVERGQHVNGSIMQTLKAIVIRYAQQQTQMRKASKAHGGIGSDVLLAHALGLAPETPVNIPSFIRSVESAANSCLSLQEMGVFEATLEFLMPSSDMPLLSLRDAFAKYGVRVPAHMAWRVSQRTLVRVRERMEMSTSL